MSNVANIQPQVYRAFGHVEILPWVALSFTAANVASIPLARRLTSILELRLLMTVSLVIFMVGAALCGAAQNMNTLIAGRAINGVGSCGVYQTYVPRKHGSQISDQREEKCKTDNSDPECSPMQQPSADRLKCPSSWAYLAWPIPLASSSVPSLAVPLPRTNTQHGGGHFLSTSPSV